MQPRRVYHPILIGVFLPISLYAANFESLPLSTLVRPLVEGLDVGQYVLEAQARGGHQARLQAVEHERVIRIRAVADADEAGVNGVLCAHTKYVSSWL